MGRRVAYTFLPLRPLTLRPIDLLCPRKDLLDEESTIVGSVSGGSTSHYPKLDTRFGWEPALETSSVEGTFGFDRRKGLAPVLPGLAVQSFTKCLSPRRLSQNLLFTLVNSSYRASEGGSRSDMDVDQWKLFYIVSLILTQGVLL